MDALWKCSVKSQMISKYFILRCIGTYSGKEEQIPHSVALKSSIRISWSVGIQKDKQRECINMAIRKYLPLKSIPQCFLCCKSLDNSEYHTITRHHDICCRYIIFYQFHNLSLIKESQKFRFIFAERTKKTLESRSLGKYRALLIITISVQNCVLIKGIQLEVKFLIRNSVGIQS